MQRLLVVAVVLAWPISTVATEVLAEDVLLTHRQAIADDAPVAHWSFDETVESDKTKSLGDGPVPPEYPRFSEGNTALVISDGGRMEIADEGEESRFDFDNGDEITVEAMVNPTKLNAQGVIVAKGRTHNQGFSKDNQNWAFRLKTVGGRAGVNFLFRSRAGDDHQGDWHRWTSQSGFAVNSGWHHVAVSYRFGDPESIVAYIDGKAVKGSWDMGGPTKAAPVVDDDEVWIGSAMSGDKGNSFFGGLDEIALYRKVVSAEKLRSRWERVEPPMVLPEPVPGKLLIHMHGPIEDDVTLPNDPGKPIATWQQDAMGFVRIPRKFDDWGVRQDWGTGVLVRAVTQIELPPGTYDFLARTRTASRLMIDGDVILKFAKQKRGGGAHNEVQPVPDVPREGMRPHAMDDVEKIASFNSPGGEHTIVFDVIVGGPKLRLEFGEACVAIAKPGEMFQLVGPTPGPELTDEGWTRFAQQTSLMLDDLDRRARREADQQSEYWDQRHALAAEHLTRPESTASIDTLLAARMQQARESSGDPKSFFHTKIRPIFAQHCYRCHGEKEKGDLNLLSQASLLSGGESGNPAVVPGDPGESYLIDLVSPDAAEPMPPKGERLSPDEIALIEQWITDGGKIESPIADVHPETPRVDDLTFLRRVWIDTVGVAPPVDEINAFLRDKRGDKRQRMISRLLDDDRWADNWMGYWQDVLAENPNLLKPMLNNTGPFRYWILESLRDNKPMDRFATELITMRGSTWGGGAGGFSVATQNDVPMAAKAHIIGTAFLAVDMKCARCHDAPYHETTQQDLFQMAAMLNRKEIKVPKTSSVPAAFFEHVKKGGRESLIDVTLEIGATVKPQWPFDELKSEIPMGVLDDDADTRQRIAADVTFSRRFAEVMANRVWKRFMGAGIVEPVDDWEGRTPSDPELLSYLADEFIRSGYDLKHLTKTIMSSDAYQRTAVDSPESLADSPRFFHGPYRRRMTAEQVVDNAWSVSGLKMDLGQLTMDVEGRLAPNYFMNFGRPKRAWEFTTMANERDRPSLAMPKIQAVVDVLLAFGWRNSRQEPTSHRVEEPNPIQPGVLANGVMGGWMTRLTDESDLTRLCTEASSLDSLIETLYLRFLTRMPTQPERESFTNLLSDGFETRVVPDDEVGPAPKRKRVPYVSWSNHLDNEANSIKQQQEEAARRGPPPTRFLQPQWRERAEDALWALLNSPEMIMVP